MEISPNNNTLLNKQPETSEPKKDLDQDKKTGNTPDPQPLGGAGGGAWPPNSESRAASADTVTISREALEKSKS